MAKNKNPYRDGSAYNKAFADLRSAGAKGITRAAMLESGHAVADITVVLSPRAEGESSRTKDCRGNCSAQGHKYFVMKKKADGAPARFVLRWRKVIGEKRIRPISKNVASQKAAKAKAKAKATKKASKAKVAA